MRAGDQGHNVVTLSAMVRAMLHLSGLGLLLACAAGSAVQPHTNMSSPDIRTFRPSVNGFAFVNHFTGSPIPFSLGGLENKIGAPSTFGLCGGMSFAAADLFLAGKAPPTRDKPPVKGEPEGGGAWFSYIQSRQLTSLGGGGTGLELAAKFGRWMALPDNGGRADAPLLGTRTMTLGELGAIRATLAEGKPVVLGLVFNRHAGNTEAGGRIGVPWENHQVLAYDAASDGASGRGNGAVMIRVYDPNYPKHDDAAIRCETVITGTMLAGPWGGVRVPVLGVECSRVVGAQRPTMVRGVFAMPYAPSPVPQTLR